MSNDLHTRLRAQLDAAARTAPAEPTLGDVIDRCQRDLTRHRRRLGAVSVSAIVSGVAVAVAVPVLLGGASTDSRVADDGPLRDAALLEECRNGSQPAYWTDLIFGSGTPRISARSDSGAQRSSTVLVSADGRYWADCGNAENASANTPDALDDAPGQTHMTVYETAASQIAPFSTGQVCASESECDTFVIDYVDRLPAEVSQVEFTTVDAETTVVDANADGFVVFDYEGTIPAEVLVPGYGSSLRGVHWLTQITYLDADGKELAGNRWAGRNLSPKLVDGLPALTAYPSLARLVQDVTAPGSR